MLGEVRDIPTAFVDALVKRGLSQDNADDIFLLLSDAQTKLIKTNLVERLLKIVPNAKYKNPKNLLVEIQKYVDNNGVVTNLVGLEKFSDEVDEALDLAKRGDAVIYIPKRESRILAGALPENRVYDLGIAPEGTIMYHYTNLAGYNGIISSQTLIPSLTTAIPNHAHFGNGSYLSDIPRTEKTLKQLSLAFVLEDNQTSRFTHCVAIDVSGLKIYQAAGAREAVFMVNTDVPLNLTGKIILTQSGPNIKP